MARSSSHLDNDTNPDPGTPALDFNVGNTIRQRGIPQPVLEDLSNEVKHEVTESPKTLSYEDPTNYQRLSPLPSSSLKVDAILPHDGDDNNDDATTSGNDGCCNEYILPHQKDPLEDETDVVDLDLEEDDGNESVEEITKPEQITITSPTTPAPVPNILKRKRNGDNPVEKKNDNDVPHEEAKRMKKPTPTKAKILTSNGNNPAKKNRRFPQEKVKCYSSRTKIVHDSSSVSQNPKKRVSPLLTATAKPKLFECLYCDASFYSIGRRRSHENNVHLRCRFCEKEFIMKRSRDEHEVTHLGLNPFRCLLCNKKFSRESYCEMHLKCLHRTDNFEENIERKCEKCGQVFETEDLVMKHIISKHLPPEDCAAGADVEVVTVTD